MADTTISTNGPISTLLRAQSAQSASLQNQQFQKTLIDKNTNGVKPQAVTPSAKTAGASGQLPRGSIVDVLV